MGPRFLVFNPTQSLIRARLIFYSQMRRAKRFRISDIQTFKDRIDVFSPGKVPEGEAIELSIYCLSKFL